MKKSAVIIFFLVLVTALSYWLIAQSPDRNSYVTVYTYSSFVSSWGPGSELEKIFEKECQCDLRYVESSDAGILLQRLGLEGEKEQVDLVIGFDQLDMVRARELTQWQKIKRPLEINETVNQTLGDSPFAAFDWGPLSFVFRQSEVYHIPQSIDDFLKPEFTIRIALEDPRTSSPGFQFLIWLVHLKGPEGAKEFLKQFANNIAQVAPSWSQAYGLFQEGHVPMVWSYITSPLVHQQEDNSQDYEALLLAEGHPIQVELMGIPSYCGNCEMAHQFTDFLQTERAQKIIMEKNYMFPIIDSVKKGTLFESIPKVNITPIDYQKMRMDRGMIIDLWNEVRRSL